MLKTVFALTEEQRTQVAPLVEAGLAAYERGEEWMVVAQIQVLEDGDAVVDARLFSGRHAHALKAVVTKHGLAQMAEETAKSVAHPWLFAAAPDIYAALLKARDVVAAQQIFHMGKGFEPRYPALLAEIDAALAAARGEEAPVQP